MRASVPPNLRAPACTGLLALCLALPACELEPILRTCQYDSDCIAGRVCVANACRVPVDAAADEGASPGGDDAGGDAESDALADAADATLPAGDDASPSDVADDGDTAAEGPSSPTDVLPLPDALPHIDPTRKPVNYVFMVNGEGEMTYTAATIASAPWLAPPAIGPVKARDAIGPIPAIDDVEAHATGHEMMVLARVADSVFAATSQGDGRWTGWSAAAKNVIAMGLGNMGLEPWACYLTKESRLVISRRVPSGDWQTTDVTTETLPGVENGTLAGNLARVDCAGIAERFEVLATDEGGQLWFATRRPAGWTRFARVESALELTVRDIDITASWGELNVVASTTGDQLHAVKVGETWTVFTSLQAYSELDPPGDVVAGGITSAFATDLFIQVTTDRTIWFGLRSVTGIVPYWKAEQSATGFRAAVPAAMVP